MEHIDSNKEKILIKDIEKALASLGGWGSVEIYVQKGHVTQITSRKITKTQHNIDELLQNN